MNFVFALLPSPTFGLHFPTGRVGIEGWVPGKSRIMLLVQRRQQRPHRWRVDGISHVCRRIRGNGIEKKKHCEIEAFAVLPVSGKTTIVLYLCKKQGRYETVF
ncbi:MAG: hypothetical protein WCL00_12910 [Bacteroidota bacterium]